MPSQFKIYGLFRKIGDNDHLENSFVESEQAVRMKNAVQACFPQTEFFVEELDVLNLTTEEFQAEQKKMTDWYKEIGLK